MANIRKRGEGSESKLCGHSRADIALRRRRFTRLRVKQRGPTWRPVLPACYCRPLSRSPNGANGLQRIYHNGDYARRITQPVNAGLDMAQTGLCVSAGVAARATGYNARARDGHPPFSNKNPARLPIFRPGLLSWFSTLVTESPHRLALRCRCCAAAVPWWRFRAKKERPVLGAQ